MIATTFQYGQVKYRAYSRAELDRVGLVVNPNMWLPDGGWHFCAYCKQYTRAYAMSSPGKSNCYEVCKECDNHVRPVNTTEVML
jgi:hypothetical protein